MTDESPGYRFSYQDKNGRFSTNKPGVLQWALAIRIVLQGVAPVIIASGLSWALYAHGGIVAKAVTALLRKF